MTGRVLVVSWDGGGNATPAVHLSLRLRRRGHDVRLLGWPSMHERARQAGVEFATYPSAPPWPDGVRLEHDGFALMDSMVNGPGTEADIIDQACDYQPDVLVIDCMMASAFRAAATLSVPTSVLCHVLYQPYLDVWGDRQLGDARAMFAGVDQVLILVPPSFEPAADLASGTAYVGPICHPDHPGTSAVDQWDLQVLAHQRDRPWLLLSLSSTPMDQHEALPPMLDALAEMPVSVLLTLGPAVDPDGLNTPPNVVVRRHVPHDAVLPYVDAVITHAGLSTITASLAAGRPMVCVPQGRDQTLNAVRVEACGAGIVVPRDSTDTALSLAIQEVLANPAYQHAAMSLAAEINALGRGQTATQMIEALLPL